MIKGQHLKEGIEKAWDLMVAAPVVIKIGDKVYEVKDARFQRADIVFGPDAPAQGNDVILLEAGNEII